MDSSSWTFQNYGFTSIHGNSSSSLNSGANYSSQPHHTLNHAYYIPSENYEIIDNSDNIQPNMSIKSEL